MVSTATSYIPVELYLKSEYEPDADYVDGIIEERPMGEWDHASWQQALQFWFRTHAREWNVRVRAEVRVQVAPSRFRVPDVTVTEGSHTVEQIITTTPLAVFEILSPEDSMKRTMRKLGDYAAMGIAEILVIDPETKAFYRFAEGQLAPETHFGKTNSRIHFALSEVEAFLDELA